MSLGAAVLIALSVWLLVPPSARLSRLLGDEPEASRWQSFVDGVRGGRRRHADDRRRALGAITALAAELQAGQPPANALVAADPDGRVWPRTLAALRVHGDVVAALRLDGRRMTLVTPLAACWTVSGEVGSGLASSVERLAQSARAMEDVRGQLEAQLAGPRATARTMALLPVIGVGMAQLAGADALGWLLGTPTGLACLVAGVGLDLVGLWWTQRINARVEAEL